jgi:hypothetical protein
MNAKAISFQTSGNLSIVQILTSGEDTFRYLVGDEAIKKGLIEVKEVNESGIVNLLVVVNKSGEFVFLMDGDILSGAKQNRVLNTSVLLAPNSTTKIPVSCVEAGRWSRKSAAFDATDYVSPSILRTMKARAVTFNRRSNGQAMADQGDVWKSVSSYEAMYNVKSRTSSLSDIFDAKKSDIGKLEEHFKVEPAANGAALFIGKSLVSVDIFNRMDVHVHYFPKLVRGAAFEAGVSKTKGVVSEAEAKFRAVDLLDRIEELELETFPGVGVGSERRFQLPGVNGFRLDYEGKLIHMAALRALEQNAKTSA